MSGLAEAWGLMVTRIEEQTGLTRSPSAISKTRPSGKDVGDNRFSVSFVSGGENIDRGAVYMVPQRVEVAFTHAVRGGKSGTAYADALRIEQRIINALHARAWQDLPVESCRYTGTTSRATTSDGLLYVFALTFDLMVYWDPDEDIA